VITEEQALLQIEIARKDADQAREALQAAEAQLLAARRAYVKTRPLTADEREQLALRVGRGDPLCCEKGRAWLLEYLPPFWADVLNGWAYETLACSDKRAEWLREYADKVRGLKLDELPPSTEST
jgi:type II secretory pathway pseudopilin PulG